MDEITHPQQNGILAFMQNDKAMPQNKGPTYTCTYLTAVYEPVTVAPLMINLYVGLLPWYPLSKSL